MRASPGVMGRSNSPAGSTGSAPGAASGEMERVGPVMMRNVEHYPDGSSVGEIDPHDEDTKNELISFLFDVDAEDRAGLEARFERNYPPDAFSPDVYDGLVVTVKNDLIAGFMDYSKTELHDPKRVAQINILVAREHRGTDIARNLAKRTDEVLIRDGYQYKFSRVWEGNANQLERKHTRGWRLDPSLTASGATRAFWIALDPRLKDLPPPRLRTAQAHPPTGSR
ncbi:hypothetical protein [Robbsia betulipollinis]|nr:hypothetical protein [Robbsia betulipollinis]